MNQGESNEAKGRGSMVCHSAGSEPQAGATGYALDAADRLSRIAAPSAAFDYAYNPWNGYVSAVTNTGGLVSEYQYDIMDRPTNIVWRKSNGSTLARFGYEYNALGMITDHVRTVGTNEVATAYGYDDLDRLASETESTGVVRTYAYDLVGNRLSKTETGSTPITYALGVGDRLATYTGGAYTHNAAGCATSIDRTGKPDLDLTWNGQYQLTSASTNGVVAESYAYDPLGRRASTTAGGVTVRHVYDGTHCVADIDSVGNVVKSYTWGPGIDNLLAVTCHSGSSATTYYALTDIQGTVHGFADANGNLVARYAYDAWGNLLEADVAVSDLADNRYLFQGREYSHATGLYNFRARWYDPAMGRWLSKDPIGIGGGLNLYAFCANDPVNSVDPWGLCEESEADYRRRMSWEAEMNSPGCVDLTFDYIGGYISGKYIGAALGKVLGWAGGKLRGGASWVGSKFSSGAAKGSVDDIVRSVDDVLRLPSGKNPGVRTVNSADEAERIFKQLSRGGEPAPGSTYPGERIRLPDGTTIGFRLQSKSGGPVVDITTPIGKPIKIHVTDP